jgi:hypothetical protein
MYRKGDFQTNRFFLSDIKSEQFKTHKLQMLVKMEQYLALSAKCRRRYSFMFITAKSGGGMKGIVNKCGTEDVLFESL